MATFIAFNEGKSELAANGLPSTCYFALSTKSVGGTSAYTGSETLAGAAFGEITGTGYTRQSQAEPAPSSGVVSFSQMTFATGTATDWPATVRSVVLCTGPAGTGKLICAWDLQSTSAARDMSQANTSELVTPTLTVG